jgi:hypothetical protein
VSVLKTQLNKNLKSYIITRAATTDNMFYASYLFLVATLAVAAAVGPAEVLLGRANGFAILSKAGISSVPASNIVGDIAVSPITAEAMTGFSLQLDDATGEFSVSTQLTGKAWGATYNAPTPGYLTTTIGDMEIAYTDAAGRVLTPDDFNNIGAGEIGGLTLTGGIYRFNTDVGITNDVTLFGGADDTWIFQISGNLVTAANKNVILAGGAQARNIFWQVAGEVTVGAGADISGIILGMTGVTFITGSSLTGRILAQTAVVLQMATIVQPDGNFQECTSNSVCAFGRTCENGFCG